MAIVGYSGLVRIGANTAADIQSWSLDIEADMLDTTALGAANGAKGTLPGLYGASGTIEANFNMADTNGQRAIQNAFFSRTALTLNLDTASSGSNRTYSGSAYVKKVSPSVSVDDLAKVSFDFVFDGAVTFS